MADLAREEADRYLNVNHSSTRQSHPEDRHRDTSDYDSDEEGVRQSNTNKNSTTTSEPAFQHHSSSHYDDTDSETEDLSNRMSTALGSSRPTYQIPTQISYANTGPKGVIADAQHFQRAKKSAFRRTLNNFTNNFSSSTHQSADGEIRSRSKEDKRSRSKSKSRSSSPNDSQNVLDDLENEGEDDEFMQAWRTSRLQQLRSQSNTNTFTTTTTQSSTSTSASQKPRKYYGTLQPVTPTGYLNAIEHTHPSTTKVLVLLHDPYDMKSLQVEDIIKSLAAKYHWHFWIRLNADVAEMEYLNAPALIGYVGGEVFDTVGDLDPDSGFEGIEKILLGRSFI